MASKDPVIEAFEVLHESLAPEGLFGEPARADEATTIPVLKVSVWGLALPFLKSRGGEVLEGTDSGLGVKRRTRELGHIRIDSYGVRWRPKMSILKLARASFLLFVAVFALQRRREG